MLHGFPEFFLFVQQIAWPISPAPFFLISLSLPVTRPIIL